MYIKKRRKKKKKKTFSEFQLFSCGIFPAEFPAFTILGRKTYMWGHAKDSHSFSRENILRWTRHADHERPCEPGDSGGGEAPRAELGSGVGAPREEDQEDE